MYVAGVLVLGLCCFHHASGALHSFKAFFTATTGISGFPEFVAAGVVDDVLTHIYTSDTKEVEPRTEWMKNSEGPDYWKRQTEVIVGQEQVFKGNLGTTMTRFNQSGGVHTIQNMYGCQWDDESEATDGFDQYAYDGEDWLTLDLKNLRYIGSNSQSVLTQNNWNSNRIYLEGVKIYRTQTCIEWGKKYLQYGKSHLERKVRPEVTLLQKDAAVVCHATGFYPDGVVITWKRDGEEMQEDEKVVVGEPLPNEDGTFQRRAVLTVSPEELKNREYTCEVAHKSGETIILDEAKIQRSNPDSVPLGPIIGGVVGLIVLIAIVAVIVMLMNRRNGVL